MANLSRTKKYADLRERLQSDTGSDHIGSTELKKFGERLNAIDSNNFSAPQEYRKPAERSATHAREISKPQEPLRRTQSERLSPAFDTSFYHRNENDTASFDNDYLDQYIREVKQYNIEQGNAATENTQMNILSQIQHSSDTKAPSRPFPRTPRYEQPFMPARDSRISPEMKISETNSASYFKRNPEMERTETFTMPAASTKPVTSRTQDLSAEDLFSKLMQDPETPDDLSNDAEAAPKPMTREDIMAEVQNLVNGTSTADATTSHPTASMNSRRPSAQQTPRNSYNESPFVSPMDMTLEDTIGTDTFSRNLQADRTTRQQLLNETAQMRAQLDDYEDNLSEVSDKMRHTNRILNIVLVVLIIALAIILGIVIYWIVISR